MVVPLAMRTGLFVRALVKTGAYNGHCSGLSASGDQRLPPPPPTPRVSSQYSMFMLEKKSTEIIWVQTAQRYNRPLHNSETKFFHISKQYLMPLYRRTSKYFKTY
jgi:hypothetical protein